MTSAPTPFVFRPRPIGCYLMPGKATDSRLALAEARIAEDIGLDAVWIAEKYDVKDLPALAGAVGALTESVQIGAAVTHLGVRHPIAVASMGQTLQSITGGRFRIGFGRSMPAKWHNYGVPAPTRRTFADTASILRTLWAGETVSYSGVAGDYPKLRLEAVAGVSPPALLLAGVGPRMLELAGSDFDGVLLHPFLTPEAVARSASAARNAHEKNGGDPATFQVIAAVVIAADADADLEDEIVARRATRYFRTPGLGESLVNANGWDPAPLEALRTRSADRSSTPRVPRSWLEESSALGDVETASRRIHDYFDAGVDEVILHGSTADQLKGVADQIKGAQLRARP
ncbi:MAG: putative Coenzyme F420-dependent N(10)-methylenetetrahydromethanopterin reductase [Pseudonocardiales bacterium]|nr:putative Coenzyme F420-dependent N(10)-methylenetetrahydromethanopterin reductase [Pseudonocardiales bacterium]